MQAFYAVAMTLTRRARLVTRSVLLGAAAACLALGASTAPAQAEDASSGPGPYHLCGSVLWDVLAGVTAAHCLDGLPPR
ncbi:hypothetical protein KNE206_68110 [Kitasatospora sp. NE20-6]